MKVSAHPFAVVHAAMMQALEAELDRQDGGRRDLPALAGRRRRRVDLAVLLEAKAKRRRRADQRAPRAA